VNPGTRLLELVFDLLDLLRQQRDQARDEYIEGRLPLAIRSPEARAIRLLGCRIRPSRHQAIAEAVDVEANSKRRFLSGRRVVIVEERDMPVRSFACTSSVWNNNGGVPLNTRTLSHSGCYL
jgi:hypothetical protein